MDNKAQAAGIAMVVSGLVGAGMTLLFMALQWFGREEVQREDVRRFFGGASPADVDRAIEFANRWGTVFEMVWGLFGLLICALIVYGGVRMYQLRQWGAALMAAILLLVPCVSPVCCTCGLVSVVGVWALIVLLDAQVKASFKP